MAVGVERRAKKVASRLDHALLLQPVDNAMSLDIAGQPSGTSYPIPETTTVQSGELGSDFNTSFASNTIDPSPSHQGTKKRRSSKDKTTTPIRRSSSTPHMRNLALGNNGELSPTDKRRNKLGYHRTSVACGHCRRRKIRCLVSQDEPTGRCANCIRLKKECNFYPVDQAPDNSRAHTAVAKETSAGAHDSSTTSSPRHPPTQNEKIDEFCPPFATTAQPGSRKYSMMNDIEVDPQHAPPHTLHLSQSSFNYPHAIDTQWPPTSTFLPSSSVSESPSSSTGYWRPSPSTANSNYGSESNVSGGHTPATMSTPSTMSYGGHPEPQNWSSQQNFQPPVRSMSYGNIEGLPQQFPNQGLGLQHQPQQQHDFSRRTSPYPYAVSIDTNPSTIHTTLGSNTAGPLSAPIIPNHQYTYPPPWQAYGSGIAPVNEMPMSGRSMSGQWFGESGPLDQVQEEGALPVGYSLHNGL
ncbi:hypothetical protein DM02DRAFT_56482 [Periconia macrospinosa]|uniref:Zn(2)-C6 fungal-type domain-containing protein n=1 Tax=Periconia macrospinosa TaxID=97972 RepID=A0A2V1E6M5_9PLEO|nr:hypothetical protein DM02DRAFT_56482 [Periconia macrospinosa]